MTIFIKFNHHHHHQYQTILNYVGFGMDLLCAIKAPRVHSQLMPPVVHVENHTLFSGKRVYLFYLSHVILYYVLYILCCLLILYVAWCILRFCCLCKRYINFTVLFYFVGLTIRNDASLYTYLQSTGHNTTQDTVLGYTQFIGWCVCVSLRDADSCRHISSSS